MDCFVKDVFHHDKKTSFFLAVAFLLSVIVTSMPLFLMKFIVMENSLLLMFFVEFIFATFVYIILLRQFHSYTIFPKSSPGYFKKTLVLGIVITIIQVAMFSYNKNIHHPQPIRLEALSLVVFVMIIPFYEEIFYRGCLFGFICSVYKRNLILPGVVTSLIFCIMHTQYFTFLYQVILFTISSILIYMRIKTKSLFYPMVLHSGMNALVMFLNAQSFYR